MGRKKKPMRFKIFILMMVCLLTFGGMKLIHMMTSVLQNKDISFEKIKTIAYREDKNGGIYSFQNGIFIYGHNQLKFYDTQGNEQWMVEKELYDPMVKSSENLLFLADKETGEISAIDFKGNIQWSFYIEKSLKNMETNQQGYIGLYTEEEGGKKEILVLNPQGKEEGSIEVTKGTILDISMADGQDLLAISVLDTQENKIESKVVLYTKTGQLLGGNQYENQLITHVFFSEDHRLMNVGDEKLIGFSKEKGLLWSKEMLGAMNKIAWDQSGLIAINIADSKKGIMDTKNQNYIWVVDMEGTDISKTAVKGNILGMDIKKGNIIAFTERTLYFISKEGKQWGEKKINNDIQGAYILSNNKILVALKNKLEIMQIKYKKQ
ncbi:DUF5711 family protein [Clostridiaceae bacterium 35-E11]